MPKPTPNELCIKIDSLKEQFRDLSTRNDEVHKEIIAKIDVIAEKLSQLPCDKQETEMTNLKEKVDSQQNMIIMGVAGLVGWLLTALFWVGGMFFGNKN
jgi:hypothetical protein